VVSAGGGVVVSVGGIVSPGIVVSAGGAVVSAGGVDSGAQPKARALVPSTTDKNSFFMTCLSVKTNRV
jgi:hypothetical protein